jgi:hypothetical protein
MFSRCVRWLCVLSIVIFSLAAQAESIIEHLPEDAIGFVTVRNLQAANAKAMNIAKMFQDLDPDPIPEPLKLVKAATGLGAGLNEQGDLLLAALPGANGPASMPLPMLLVPVSDYAAFAGSVNGDVSGEVCRVTISGEEVLVAKRGSYAVLMNVDNRDRLESLLSSPPKTPAGLQPMTDWLAKIDVAAVLTPSGLDLLTSMGQAGLAGQRANLDAQLGDPQLGNTLRQLKQTFEMYEAILGFLGAELDSAAVGFAIDDQSNLKLVTQAVLAKGGKLADAKGIEPGKQSPLTPYANEPFVMAAGGPMPPSYGETAARFMREMFQKFPTPYGFEKLTEDQWKEVEAMWGDTMRGLSSMSMCMLPGEGDEPLMSNLYGVFKVEDSAKYLTSYREAMKKWNDLLASTSSDIKLHYETEETEVGGKKALFMSTDVAAAAGDQNVPMFQNMLKAMVGEDGKSKAYLIAADQMTVVMAMSDGKHAAKFLEQFEKHATGLADAAQVQTAVKLLDPQAPWIAVISPKGCVTWFSRFFDKVIAMTGGVPMLKIPEYPDSPALGISFKVSDGRVNTELVLPKEAIQTLVAYIKKCMGQ